MKQKIIFFLLSITLISVTYGKDQRPTICLNMIVKNESHVIKRSLGSVKDVIDYWVIVDTGSTDGTQEIIQEFLKDIPGELHERPWVNFAHNRTEALEFAKGKADYLMFLDADDWIEFDPNHAFPELTKDIYHAWWNLRTPNTYSYTNIFMVKNSLPWIWKGAVHNFITCDPPQYCTSETLTNLRYVFGGDGARSKDPKKFEKNAQIIEEELKKDPTNRRYMFYLGESYRDAKLPEKAIEAYERRAEMGGWDQEVFWSLFQIARLSEQLNWPTDLIIENYQKAHRYRPQRAEPIYYLANLYNRQKEYDLAYECIKGWLATPKLQQKDILFTADWIEHYGITFQLSLSSYYVGEYEESLALCNQLLNLDNLPENWRTRTENNREFSLEKLN